MENKHKNPEKIWVLAKKWMWLTVDDIVYCKTNSDCTKVHMKKGDPHNISGNLSETERLIDSDDFFDIHQTYRANLNYWDGEKVATADRLLGLTTGNKLPVADRKLSKLRAELKKRKNKNGSSK
jgi:two-component system, LytTR family, response regulator